MWLMSITIYDLMVFVSLLGVKSEDLSGHQTYPAGPDNSEEYQFLLIEENIWIRVEKFLWAFPF